MDTNKYYHHLKKLTGFVIFCSIAWILWTSGRTANSFLFNPEYHFKTGIEWIQGILIFGYCFLPFLLILLHMKFLMIQLKVLKNGCIFHPKCYPLLLWWAALWIPYDICASNLPVMYAENFEQICFSGSILGIPVLVSTFAILYKISAQVAEENRLTI